MIRSSFSLSLLNLGTWITTINLDNFLFVFSTVFTWILQLWLTFSRLKTFSNFPFESDVSRIINLNLLLRRSWCFCYPRPMKSPLENLFQGVIFLIMHSFRMISLCLSVSLFRIAFSVKFDFLFFHLELEPLYRVLLWISRTKFRLISFFERIEIWKFGPYTAWLPTICS